MEMINVAGNHPALARLEVGKRSKNKYERMSFNRDSYVYWRTRELL